MSSTHSWSHSDISSASSSSSSSASARSESTVPSSPSVAAAVATADALLEQQKTRGHRLPSIASNTRVPSIRLTAEEQAQYDRALGRLLYRAAQEYTANAAPGAKIDRNAWTPVRKSRSMKMYKGANTAANPRVSLMLGVGKIDGSLEDVMDGIYSESSLELRTVFSFVNAKNTIGKMLQVLETRTPDDPFTYAGIKWIVSKMPGGAVSHDRDVLYYERQGLTFDAQGNEVGFHVMHSIERPEWPANAFKGMLRTHSCVCWFHWRCGSRVETFFWGEIVNSGSIPRVVSDYAIAGKWMSVSTALRCSEAKKLSQLRQSVSAARTSSCSITISDIDHCDLCQERRGLFSSQQLCGCCQQNVCKSCSVEKQLFELDASGHTRTDRFCKRCLTQVAKQRGSKIVWKSEPTSARSLPLYFDYVFVMASKRSSRGSKSSSSSSSSSSAPHTNDSMVKTTYVEESVRRLDNESARGEERDDGPARRRRQFIERLSSCSYTKEQFLADLSTESDSERSIY